MPDSYRYVLTSSCGERGLIGDYEIVVQNGAVASALSLNADYPYEPRLDEIPTLADLQELASTAKPETVVNYKVDESGLPRLLSLDPNPNGIDEEECYEVSKLRPQRG